MQKNKSWLLIVGFGLLILSLFVIKILKKETAIKIPDTSAQPTVILDEPNDKLAPIEQINMVVSHPVEEIKEIIQVITEPEPVIITKTKQQPTNAAPKQTCQYHLFFDIRNILLESSGTSALKEIGVSNMFWYTVKHKKTPNHTEIQNRLFEFMDYCTQKPRSLALFNNEPMPYLMYEWAAGRMTAEEMIDNLLSYQKEIKEFFVSVEEKNLVLGTLNLLKPEAMCNIQKPNSKMIHFFQHYCTALPNRVYILSNWDSESIKRIYKKYPEIFDKIDQEHVLLSSDIGSLKPEVDIFNHVTKKLKIDPNSCILIDDSPENIRVAKSLGWHAVLHKDIELTIKELSSLINDQNCEPTPTEYKKKSKKKKKTSKK